MKLFLTALILFSSLSANATTAAFWCDAKQDVPEQRSDVPEFGALKIKSVTVSDGGPHKKSIPFEQSKGGGLLISSDNLNKSDFLSIKFQTQSGLEIWVRRISDGSMEFILPKTNVIISGKKFLGLNGQLDPESDVILNCKDEQ